MKPTILEHLNWRWTDDTIYRNILNTGSHKSEVFQDFLNFLPIWHALYICTIYGRTDSFWICLEIDFLTLEMKVLTIFFFYLIARCQLSAVSNFSISSPKQVNISTKLTTGYPLVKGLQIYPRERTPLQVKIWLQYVGNELATNFFFRITESSLPY